MSTFQQTIQELKQNITVAQAIEYYTGQRPSHGKYLCPFHNDRHPSLTIKGEHWRCWSCNAQGDIFDFTMQYFSIGFKDAVMKLAADFNVPVEIGSYQSTEDREQIAWDRIARECDRENRRQLREYLDKEIDKYNSAYRAAISVGVPESMLGWLNELLDNLIFERGA